MSGPIGHTYIYNFIILFIVIVFAFLAGSLSYYKAFKVNNIIIGSLEKYEGYNALSKTEIEVNLSNLGYTVSDNTSCADTYKGMSLVSLTGNPEEYEYCIYVDSQTPSSGEYYTYGVVTRMNIDLPVIDRLSLPVFTRTNRIFKFTN